MITLEGTDSKMIANNLMSAEPVHPGELIKDEIEFRGLTQKQLAVEMGMSPSLLNEILNGRRRVSTEYALLFEAVLGIDAMCGSVCRPITICRWPNQTSRSWSVLQTSGKWRQYYSKAFLP